MPRPGFLVLAARPAANPPGPKDKHGRREQGVRSSAGAPGMCRCCSLARGLHNRALLRGHGDELRDVPGFSASLGTGTAVESRVIPAGASCCVCCSFTYPTAAPACAGGPLGEGPRGTSSFWGLLILFHPMSVWIFYRLPGSSMPQFSLKSLRYVAPMALGSSGLGTATSSPPPPPPSRVPPTLADVAQPLQSADLVVISSFPHLVRVSASWDEVLQLSPFLPPPGDPGRIRGDLKTGNRVGIEEGGREGLL